MAEINRLNGDSDWIGVDFIQKEETPRQLMQYGIELHLASLSLAETTSFFDIFGIDRCRSTVHNWVRTTDFTPADGARPDHVAVDETVIQVNDQRYWSFAAVDPDTNIFLHVRLFPTRTTAIAEIFLSDLQEKHDVSEAEFLVNGTPWLQAVLHRCGLRFRHVYTRKSEQCRTYL
jgi:transposase-like protein